MRILTLLFLLLIPGLMAQDTSAKKEAEMADDVKAIIKKAGKAMNIDKIKDASSLIQTANMTIANMGMNGSMKVTLKDDKIHIESKMANMVETQAYDGKVAWAENLVMGFRKLKGAEKLTLIAETLPYSFNPEKFYDKIELIGKEEFNGVECFKIKSSKEGLDPIFEYVDTKNYILQGEERTVDSPVGKMKIKAVYVEFKQHKTGFSYPSKLIQHIGPTQMEITISEIKVNEKVDDKIFKAPAQ